MLVYNAKCKVILKVATGWWLCKLFHKALHYTQSVVLLARPCTISFHPCPRVSWWRNPCQTSDAFRTCHAYGLLRFSGYSPFLKQHIAGQEMRAELSAGGNRESIGKSKTEA